MKRTLALVLSLVTACAFAQDSYISELPEDASIDGTEWFWCEDSAFTIDSRCEIADIITAAGGSILVFKTIDTPAGTDPVADTATDTLVITCGTGLTCTGTSGTDTVDFTPSEAGLESFLDLQDLQGAITDAQVPDTITINLAATATALAANGANCAAASFPLGVDASGAVESCTALSASNAGTATALAANGANCSAGNYPLGVDASGAVETCTADDDLPDADEVVETMFKAVDAAGDEECLTYESTVGDFEWQSCGSGGGDSITVNSSAATDPDFLDGDIDWTLTGGNSITATVGCSGCVDATDLAADSVATSELANDAVEEANLKAVDAASDEECLTYETTTGDFEWQSCGSGGTTITVEEDNASVDAAVTNLDFTEPDATIVTSSPAGEANVQMGDYVLSTGRTGGELVFAGLAEVDNFRIRSGATASDHASGVTLDGSATDPFVRIRAGETDADATLGASHILAEHENLTMVVDAAAPGGAGEFRVTDQGATPLFTVEADADAYLGDDTLQFEGATADGFELDLAITDPTADWTLTTPAWTGTIATKTQSTTLPATCTEGQMYQDTDSGGSETYECTAADTWTKFDALSLTVREADGSPTAATSTLEFDQADGFVMTDEGGGVVEVDLNSVSQSQASENAPYGQYDPDNPPASCATCDEFTNDTASLTWTWGNQDSSVLTVDLDSYQIAGDDAANEEHVRATDLPSAGNTDFTVTVKVLVSVSVATHGCSLGLIESGTIATPTEITAMHIYENGANDPLELFTATSYAYAGAAIVGSTTNTNLGGVLQYYPMFFQLRYTDSTRATTAHFSTNGLIWSTIGSTATLSSDPEFFYVGAGDGGVCRFLWVRVRTDSARNLSGE